MGRPAPNDDDIGRAWELHCQNFSSRYIGEALGVSHTTAISYIRTAELALEYGQVHTASRDRQAMHDFLRQLAAWGVERLESGGVYEEVGPVILKVTDQINRMKGHYAAITVDVNGARPAPSPELLATIQAATDRANTTTRELLAGDED